MRAAVYWGPHCIELAERSDPVVAEPTDAVVRVALTCVSRHPARQALARSFGATEEPRQ